MQTELLKNEAARTGMLKPSRGRVLVVDDEEQNRTLLRDQLESYNYEVEEAVDGLEALEKMAHRPADVVLLDIMMPGMDGFEVCRRLKKDAATEGIPVLMITALSERKERLMGMAAGANDFLNKPVDLQDLMLRVRNAVFLKQLFDQLEAEQQKSERLLLNVLPQPIAARMKKGELTIADQHDDVSVLLADLVGFTTLAAHIGPQQVVILLNEIFSEFDLLVEKHAVQKIKTIGDAYMVAGGLEFPRPEHPQAMGLLALSMMEEMDRLNSAYNTSLRLRIGIHAGPVIAGVIGRNKFAYDLWGDTVNLACQIETHAEPGTIQCSEEIFQRLCKTFRFEPQKISGLKGRRELQVYRLQGRI